MTNKFSFAFVVGQKVVGVREIETTIGDAIDFAVLALDWAQQHSSRKVTFYGVGVTRRQVLSESSLDLLGTYWKAHSDSYAAQFARSL